MDASAAPRRVPRNLRQIAVPILAVLVASLLLGSGTDVRAAKRPACSLVPQLRDVAITQGVGAYTPLVRGKEALVRAYLAKPSCAASGSIIELTGGSVVVTPANAAAVTIAAPTPRPTAPYPQLAAATAAPLVDSPGDPLWVVPGSALAPSTTTARFTATFRITVTYQSRTSSTATPVAGSVTFTTRPGTSTPIATTVESRTNALRILVVPMGDASRPYAESYTAAGDAALQAAMLTLSRIYPVADGVGSLTGTTGGLRYSVSPGLLDLRSLLGADGRFCGTGGSSGNFNAIKASLGQFLQSWNAANSATFQADRVLGVVDAAISNGSAAGCAEGMAAINSNEAWIRAVPEAQGVPSQSGFVAALEIGHTFGLVLGGPSPTADRDDVFSKYHSPNVYADPLRLNRSYNTRLRSVVVDDRTAMTYIGSANNNNTLLEQLDWAYLLCRLGGATSTECPAQAVLVGSGAGVAAGPRFLISGVTDGTAAGTSVLESFFSSDMLPTPPAAGSPYRLVYRNGAAIVADLGLPTQAEDSAHDDDGDPHETAALALFSGAFDFQTSATRIELWRGAPGSGVLLYARDRTTAPVLTNLDVTPATGGPMNFTADIDLEDIEPSLSADGRWLAWAAYDPTVVTPLAIVRVAPVEDPSAQTVLMDGADSVDSTQPAWCADGARIAYVDTDGDLWLVDIDTGTTPAAFGTRLRIYDSDTAGPPAASHPTWSPDCAQLAFEADDDIWRIDADGTDLVALTNDDASHDPSWSPDPDDNRIAFVQGGFFTLFSGPTIAGLPEVTLASFVSPTPEAPIVVQSHGGNDVVVNSTDDVDDGSCDALHCSLREGILAANATPNFGGLPDAIEFQLPGLPPYVITPATSLPFLTDALIIDGATQAGYAGTPLIEIDGSGTPAGTDGITLAIGSDGSGVRGIAVNGFPRDGIRIFTDDAVIEGAYLGVGLDGTSDRGNGAMGVNVIGASGTHIGAVGGVGSGNVVSGNGQHGITVAGSSAVVDTVISGNLIGTDATGTAALGNTGYGILLGSNSVGTLVGGLTVAERNVISANGFGVVVGIDGVSNVIQGNYIGTDATGAVDLGNVSQGIEINQGASTTIGGTVSGAGNLISGNGSGVFGADGIRIVGTFATGTLVRGNTIGISATGAPMGNTGNGIVIDLDANQNRIGGAGNSQNAIANNGGAGIRVADGTGNTIRANAIVDNGELGIDIGPSGVTANDLDDADGGANDLHNFPIITSAEHDGGSVTISGSINSLPSSTQTLDLYVNQFCDPSGNGEGHFWVAQDVVVLDPGGDATFSVSGLGGINVGDVITATASDGAGNSTSEFSACVTVTAGETGTFTVNTTDDTDDGLCGIIHCSLREAIERANTSAGYDTISFDLPGAGQQTISLATPLPPITDAVNIDGTTQPGFAGTPLVVLSGPSGISSGLVLDSTPAADGSTIQALALVDFGAYGIEVHGSSHWILDNYVGTSDGITAAPNGSGVAVGTTADHVEIRGNLISGNTGAGVDLDGDENQVHGNRIGTDATAEFALPNGGAGIRVLGGVNQRIGTEAAGDGNVISGNTGTGIVVVASASIQGNRIGTNAPGTAPVGNGAGGIDVDGGFASIGGSVVGMGNQISGNFGDGIAVRNNGEGQIHGNLIGTNAAGTGSLANTGNGVTASAGGVLGSLGGPGVNRNVISGNDGYGVHVLDHPGTGTLTTINENYIGTNASASAAVPNAVGVVVTDSSTVIIGQDTGGSVISGNVGPGILVNGTSTGTEIGGNVIGLDVSATVAIPNGDAGIYLADTTSGALIGDYTGVTPSFGNVIAGNVAAGIHVDGSDGNLVDGNRIGTNAAGADLGNGDAGVLVVGGQSNRIGADQAGTAVSGPGNVIAFNDGAGVELTNALSDADFNSILSNAIFANVGIGIDLDGDGVTLNDPGDGDDGANDLTNFPDLVDGVSDGITTDGSISSTTAEPDLVIVYQLFVSSTCDGSDHGEGERYLATVDTVANGSGVATAPFSIPEDLEGEYLTATTTDLAGQTSEFSQCFLVTNGGGSSEVRLLDPTAPLGPTTFVVDGDSPAWRVGSLVYRAGDEIHRIAPDGTGDETVTTGFVDAMPSGAAGITAFVRTAGGGDDDVWLLVEGQTVAVGATAPIPEDLRLDLYYVCGGQSMPIAVGLVPDQTAGTTASFQTNFDPSLSCAGGTIEAAVTDGFLRTTTPPGEGEPLASDPKPPVASTYGPPIGATYLTSDVIPFHGLGEDAEDGTLGGGALRWFIRPAGAPCCGTLAGSGGSVDFDAAALAPGDYIVSLVATDADGSSDVAQSLIHVVADSDHDGLSDATETGGCFGAGAATDGSTGSGDADGDGLPNASDPEPCVRATVYTAIVDFDPNDLNLTSSGTPVTVKIRTPGRDIRQVVGSSVRIVGVGGAEVSFPNTGWSVSGGVGTAKFSRQTLVTFLRDNGITVATVPIVVTGSSTTNPAWSFEGRDTTKTKP